MAMLSFCGIDVSKDRLDVMVLPEQQCSSVRNDVAGWSELIERLRGLSIAAIGLEASGGYERGVMRALLAAGMSVRQINPFKLRQFAKASGVLAKNDRLDARMIASFVAIEKEWLLDPTLDQTNRREWPACARVAPAIVNLSDKFWEGKPVFIAMNDSLVRYVHMKQHGFARAPDARPSCMTRQEHSERRRESIHESAPVATGSPRPSWIPNRE